MEKKTMFALAALAAATNAFASIRFMPGDAPTPYDWNTPSLWWDSDTEAYINALPTSADDVAVYDMKTRDNPLFINSGTAAAAKAFYLSTPNTSSNPMLLTINGGSLTTSGAAYFGYKNPALLTIQNGGAYTANSSLWIAPAKNTADAGSASYNVKVLIADANSSLTINSATFYLANQNGGTALIENHGSLNLLGSGTSQRDVWLGYSTGRRTLGAAFSVIDNYGTITSTDYRRWFVGGTMGYTGIVSNHVGAVIDKGYAFCIGSGSNTVGRLVNEGTINGVRFSVGGCTYHTYSPSLSPALFAQGYLENSGTINASGFLRVGWQTNSVGHAENTGDINGTSEFIMGYCPGAKGYFRHSAGNLDFTGSVYVGYQGYGYLELAGNTETVFDKSSNLYIAQSGTQTSGELVITNSASLSRGGKPIIAAGSTYGAARIALYDDAALRNVGEFRFGNVRSDCSFEAYDNAVVSNIDLLVLNVGTTTSSAATGTTRMKLSGNAKVCDLTNAYIGSNTYNRAELEIADNAWFGLRDDAWTNNLINVARDSYKSGDATIRMRGGMIGLGIRGGLVLGSTNDNVNVQCTSRIIGYGCVTNQGDRSKTVWSRLDIRAGSATADGEGVERDLDLSTFARVSGSSGEGRTHLNVSGTNGWYAINKGRLLYPNMDGELIRFVGEYSRLTDAFKPKLVNAMKIILKDANDTEVTDHRRFNIAMYAPDRTDIPAGLVEDDATNRRLGIWKGHVTSNASGKFTTADATIRYDHWRLGELMNAQGAPSNVQICLYKHDGTANGKWKRVASYSAADAAANEYRINGEISNEVSSKHDIGWFAVVAKEVKGSVIFVR